jgi:predicted phosphoserine aminotransferase
LERILFTAGPVEVRREVLNAMTRPMITHRGNEYKKLHRSIVDKLKELLRTENDIFLIPSSSTGAMEAAVRSSVRESILHMTCGAFGDRWIEISRSNGKRVKTVSADWGRGFSPSVIDSIVDSGEEAIAITHNETSTGVMNPLADIAERIHEASDALLFVDAVTSAFGTPLDFKRVRPDILIFGTQKALALPPGLAVAVVSDRAMDAAKRVENRGRYLDLVEIKEFADRNLVPTTPPISLMYALDFQLDRIKGEGMEARTGRHRKLGEMARRWASERMSVFTENGFYSDTVTCVRNTSGKDYGHIEAELGKRGYQISEGYGKLKGETFRIGHMGDLTEDEMAGLLDALTEVVA